MPGLPLVTVLLALDAVVVCARKAALAVRGLGLTYVGVIAPGLVSAVLGTKL